MAENIFMPQCGNITMRQHADDASLPLLRRSASGCRKDRRLPPYS